MRRFETDEARWVAWAVENLAARMPAGVVKAALSGIKGAADMRRLAEAGYDAALVGESVMIAPDRAAAVRALAQPGEGPGPA